MARHLIQNATTGDTRIVGDAALAFFPGYIIRDTLEDGQPPFLFYSGPESDLRYVNVGEISDPESAASVALRAASVALVAPGIRDASNGLALTLLPGGLYNQLANNAVSYAQDNVTTQDGVQYAVWSDSGRNPTIGKRTLPFGEWETFNLTSVTGNPLDSPTVQDLHNDYVVAVDSTGHIHVSGNMHGVPLNYIRSTSPGNITAWTAPGMVGANEDEVTYPQFVRAGADLLFFYRRGSSGSGDIYVNAYNTTTKTWTRRSNPFNGSGGGGTTENCYLNHIAVDAAGTIHVFYLWRETADVSSTHDIGYVKSTDKAATWRNAAGVVQTLPMTPTTAPVVVAGNNKAINQNGADADQFGNPHSAWWLQLTAGVTQLVHVWHDGTTWQQDVEESLGADVPTVNLARPSVFCVGKRTFVIYTREATGNRRVLRCKDITPAAYNLLRYPEFSLLEADLKGYEPSFDTRALRERNELHMLVTPTQDTSFTNVWGGIRTLDLDTLPETSTERSTVARAGDTIFHGAGSGWLAAAGSPADLSTGGWGAPGWSLDAATTEVLYGSLSIPRDWRTFDVDAWWINTSTGSGNVRLNFRHRFKAVGTSMPTNDVNNGDKVAAAGGQYGVVATSVATGLARPPGESVLAVNLRRVGQDATDTLAADIAFLGLMLRRTS